MSDDWGSIIDSAGLPSPAARATSIFGNLGWSPVQAAGIVGNLQHESASPNLNPLAVGDSGSAFGLAQWHPDRVRGLVEFAKQYNLNPQAVDTQLLYVDHELRNSEVAAGNKLKQAQTPQDAVAAMAGYERPRGYSPNHPENSAGFASRLANANALFSAQTPMTVGPDQGMDMSQDPTPAQAIDQAGKTDWGSLIDSAAAPQEAAPQGTSWQSVGTQALENAPSDLFNQAKGFLGQIANPVGTGLQAGQALATPEGRQALIQHYLNYASEEGIKKNIAEHPVGVVSDVTNAALLGRGLIRGVTPEITATQEAMPNPVIEAANAENVQIPNVLMKPEGVQNAARKISDYPFAGTPLTKSVQTATQQLGEAKDRLVSSLGSGNADLAGANARQGLANYVENPNPAVTEGYRQVEAGISPTATTPLTNTIKTVQDINAQRATAGLPEMKATDVLGEALTRPGGLTYNGLKFLRTYIGQALKQHQMPANIPQAEMERIYGGLSEDLKAAVSNAGGDVKTFNYANDLARLVAGRRQKLLTILGAKNDEGVVERILAKASSGSRADVKTLAIAKSAMSKSAWNDVASSAVQRLGLDKTGDFSPERFLTSWQKLNESGKRLLFDKETRRHLDNIATISTKHGEFERFANRSKTGASVFTAAGFSVSPLVALKAIVGGRAIAHLLSRPATLRYVTRWTKAYTSKNKNALTQATAGINGLLRNNQ